MTISDLARIVDVGMTILAQRVLTIVALVMVFAIFCWAMIVGDYLHFWIAGAFGILIFLPVLVADRKPEVRNGDQDT